MTPTFSLTTGDLSGDMCKLYGEGLLTLTEELECLPLLATVMNIIIKNNLVKLDVTGSAPMVVTSAEGRATLLAVECPDDPLVERSVEIEPWIGSVSLDQHVSIAVQPKVLGRTVDLITVEAAASAVSGGGTQEPEIFLESELGEARTVGSSSLGLADLLSLDTSNVQLGTVQLDKILDRFDQRLVDEINGALDRVDQQVLARLAKTLGFSLGSADLTAIALDCDSVRLVG